MLQSSQLSPAVARRLETGLSLWTGRKKYDKEDEHTTKGGGVRGGEFNGKQTRTTGRKNLRKREEKSDGELRKVRQGAKKYDEHEKLRKGGKKYDSKKVGQGGKYFDGEQLYVRQGELTTGRKKVRQGGETMRKGGKTTTARAKVRQEGGKERTKERQGKKGTTGRKKVRNIRHSITCY